MDKAILKQTILGLEVDQKISINFRGSVTEQSGDFVVVGHRRGRGKGGSQLLDVTREGDTEILTFGTPRSEDILNMVVDGLMVGYATEAEVPAVYETNAERAVQLKETFKGLLDASENSYEVAIVAPQAPEINNRFTVVNARQLRGRGGQIVLELRDADGNETEVWSYRHSGVVTDFTVFND